MKAENASQKQSRQSKSKPNRPATAAELLASRRKRNSTAAIVLTLFAVVALIAALVAIYETQFIIDDIELSGLTKYKTEQVEQITGKLTGSKLYSFSASALNDEVVFSFPYIKCIEVDRKMPSTVCINIIEETAVYYTIFGGELFVFNENLKVLGCRGIADVPDNLIKLKLPDMKRLVAGSAVVFSDDASDSYVREFLSQVSASPIFARLNMIDIRNKFDITVACDRKYLLELGNMKDCDIKLLNAIAVLKDTLFASGNKATVKLSDIYETSVIIDNQISLD